MYSKFVITLAFATFCSAANALDFYVSPSGNDILNGLSPRVNFWAKTGPFKTLARAQQAIRTLKATGNFNEAITVRVSKGTYPITAALEFSNADSGEPGREINWVGEQGTSIISGGITLKNCDKYDAANPNKILTCPIAASSLANIIGETNDRITSKAPQFELFVNERKMHLARWPDSGWAYIRQRLETPAKFSVFQTMPAFTGDFSDAQVHAFPSGDWLDQYLSVSALDIANNQITLSPPNSSFFVASGRRFYLENIGAALNTNEEWFYDKTNNRLQFIPPSNTTPTSIILSSAKRLINVNGTRYVGFKNLTFRHSAGDAIRMDRADEVSFDNSEISNIGGSAMRAVRSTNVTISNSHIYNLGTGGIWLSGGDRTTLQPSNNLIYNNHIHDYDTKIFAYAAAAEVGGVACTISHNKIENGNSNAILLNGNDHIIEKNEIAKVIREVGDAGAIYAGRDWTFRGNVIRYNYIHDFSGTSLGVVDLSKNLIRYNRGGGKGIYLDDAISGFTVFGNIMVNAGSLAIHVGGGRDNVIENNFIKTNESAMKVDNRWPTFFWDRLRATLTTMPVTSPVWLQKYPELGVPMAHDTWPEGNTIRRNVILANSYRGYFLRYQVPAQSSNISNNLYWHPTSQLLLDYTVLDTGAVGSGAFWSDWTAQGVETNSINADPCLKITGVVITQTCANSPISKIGFQNLPTDMGLL